MINWLQKIGKRLQEIDNKRKALLERIVESIVPVVLIITLLAIAVMAVVYVAEWIFQPPGPCDFWKAPVGRKAC
jgi:hypothetical protein